MPEKDEPGGPVLEPDQERRDHDRDDGDVEDVLNPESAEHRQGIFDHVNILLFPPRRERPAGLRNGLKKYE